MTLHALEVSLNLGTSFLHIFLQTFCDAQLQANDCSSFLNRCSSAIAMPPLGGTYLSASATDFKQDLNLDFLRLES